MNVFKVVKTFLVIFFALQCFGQMPLDTVESKLGKMVMYSDQSWELIKDTTFDGILNKDLHRIMSSAEVGGPFVMKWDDNDCYTRANNLTKLKDTIWLCLDDDSHGSFTIPIDGPVTSRYKYRHVKYHN